MQPSKGPQAGVLGPRGPDVVGNGYSSRSSSTKVFIPCSLFLASGRSCEHVLPFLFFFFIVSFFFFNLTIVGLQCWASFSCITSDSFIVNCCKILTMIPCSNVSHSVMSDPMDCSQAPLSMEFSGREYWSGWPFASPMVPCAIQ